MKLLSRILVAGLWLLALLSTVHGAEVLVLDPDAPRWPLTPTLSVHRDPSGAQALPEVRQIARQGRFEACSGSCPAFGFSTDAIWGRFAVRSASRSDALWWLQVQTARLDQLQIFFVHPSGEVEHLVAGNMGLSSPQVVDGMWPTFPLRLEAGEQVEVFLRAQSETAIRLPVRIWEARHFAGFQARQEAPYAAFFGYLGALILLGFVFSALARDRGYAIYSLSLVTFFAWHLILSGHYAWLDLPGRAFMVKKGLVLVCEFGLAMMLLYLRHLLDLARSMPRVDPWARALQWSTAPVAGLFLVFPFGAVYPFFILQAVLVGMFSLAVALAAWRQGSRAGGYYALAWVLFWVLFGVGQLHFLAWLPMSFPPEWLTMLGTALGVTLFLIAMVDRVREIRHHMQQAQSRALDLERQATRELRLQMQQEQLLIRDLHDGIGGLTANVAILAELGRRAAPEDAERERFARISELASEGGAEVRSLISSIEARDMSWPDFFDECRRHGHIVLAPHGIGFAFAAAGDASQPGPGLYAGLSLFRVFKEALTNAVKHSGCTEVSVRAELGTGEFRLTVRDNGRGVSGDSSGGRGMRNMASRIHELGGTMSLDSQGGMALVFSVPLPLTLAAEPAREDA